MLVRNFYFLFPFKSRWWARSHFIIHNQILDKGIEYDFELSKDRLVDLKLKKYKINLYTIYVYDW